MVCIYCAKTNVKKQSSINDCIVTYTRHTFEQPKKKYVHLLHYFCFFADDFQVCFGCKMLVAGLKLGNENGCKCNAHKEHKDPVDESARKAKEWKIPILKCCLRVGSAYLKPSLPVYVRTLPSITIRTPVIHSMYTSLVEVH